MEQSLIEFFKKIEIDVEKRCVDFINQPKNYETHEPIKDYINACITHFEDFCYYETYITELENTFDKTNNIIFYADRILHIIGLIYRFDEDYFYKNVQLIINQLSINHIEYENLFKKLIPNLTEKIFMSNVCSCSLILDYKDEFTHSNLLLFLANIFDKYTTYKELSINQNFYNILKLKGGTSNNEDENKILKGRGNYKPKEFKNLVSHREIELLYAPMIGIFYEYGNTKKNFLDNFRKAVGLEPNKNVYDLTDEISKQSKKTLIDKLQKLIIEIDKQY